MEFCPNCGAMLLPKDNKLECSCGYSKDLSETNSDQYEVAAKVKENDNVIMKREDMNLRRSPSSPRKTPSRSPPNGSGRQAGRPRPPSRADSRSWPYRRSPGRGAPSTWARRPFPRTC